MVGRPALILATLAMLLAAVPGTGAACSEQAPRPPILENAEYDATARSFLVRESSTIAVARFQRRLEMNFGEDFKVDYVFEIIEGWKAPLPRRLVVNGGRVPCDLPLVPGNPYLVYFEGERPLWFVPGVDLSEELLLLADLDWFYGPRGDLVTPSLISGQRTDP
jgi:hypothetical protein